jgi:hypothetical protein
MLVNVSAAVPESVTVIDWGALVVPTDWVEKVMLVGDRVIAGLLVELLEPPPQPAKTVSPKMIAERRTSIVKRAVGAFTLLPPA